MKDAGPRMAMNLGWVKIRDGLWNHEESGVTLDSRHDFWMLETPGLGSIVFKNLQLAVKWHADHYHRG